MKEALNALLATLLLFSASSSIAISKSPSKQPTNNEHRHHGAHSHGSATLSIAFDDLIGKIEFKGAAMGVLNFEHEPKSLEEKADFEALKKIFELEIQKLIGFEPGSQCVMKNEKIELQTELSSKNKIKSHSGEHSNFVATYTVTCAKSLLGTKISFDFTRFKNVKDIDVTLLIADLQKNFEIKSTAVTLEIK